MLVVPLRFRFREGDRQALQLRRARKAGRFDEVQEAGLEERRAASQRAAAAKAAAKTAAKAEAQAEAKAAAGKAKSQTLMEQVLKLGCLPRENGKEGAQLAQRIRHARKAQLFDSSQLAQLGDLQNQTVRPARFGVFLHL